MQDVPAELSRRLTAISETGQVVPLRAATMHALALLGIRSGYFLAPLTADPRIGRILTNIGLPATWEKQYRARLHKVDPLPGISLDSSGAFRWPEDIDRSALDKRQARYLQIAGQHGLLKGIGVACYGPHGRSGFLGCAWTESEPPDDVTLQRVEIIGQTSFRRYCKLVRNDGEVPPLSNRELEVMTWMCAGKSNPVIAELLGISRSSIDVYVRRIFQKLEVSDRTAACLRAYSLGLTVTGEYQRLVQEAADREPGTEVKR